jgi:hypothetical protein
LRQLPEAPQGVQPSLTVRGVCRYDQNSSYAC